MDSFKKYLESQGKSKSTVKHYNSYLLDFLAWLDIDDTEIENATAKEVLSYLNYLQKKGQENKTRNIRLNVIKQYFNWQVEQGERADNPVQHLKIRGTSHRKLYPILSIQELDQLYYAYNIPDDKDPRSNRNWFTTYRISRQRNKAILSLLVHQGLTTAEIARLCTTDLKLREGTIYIAGGRKSAERTLQLQSHQIIDLMEYTLQTRKTLLDYQQDKTTDRLFLSVPTAGQAQTGKNTLSVWKGLTRELKKQHKKLINLKQVRASVITHWLKTYNLREVQYMAGHRYVSSTEAYLVNQTDDLLADIDQYHPIKN